MVGPSHFDGNPKQPARPAGASDETDSLSDQPIHLQGELTLEHRVKAQLLVASFSINKWMALFGTVFFAAIPWFYLNHKGFWFFAIFCWLFSISSFLMYWFSPQLDAALVRSQLSRQFKENLPLTLDLRPVGLYVVTPDTETIVAWSSFHRICESKDLILLFHRGMAQFQIFPREFCESDQQWNDLREYLAAKFPPA